MSDDRLSTVRALLGKAKATLARPSWAALPSGVSAAARAHLLTVVGLGLVDVGVFDANPIAGWVTTGVSVLVLDWKVQG